MANSITAYDTIAAISTPPGEGGISIVRLSGDEAIQVAQRVFKGKDLANVPTHTINYGHIVDPATQDVVDEVMVSVMRAPKTYTREDVIEINCHGGIVDTNRILQLLLSQGARMAEPGEFTKRAFLNGRIDLTQAESVMDLIRAKTDKAMQVAVDQLDGNLSHLIKNLRQDIFSVLGQEEVNIDYPEYEMDEVTGKMMLEKAQEVRDHLVQLLKTANQGKILREGLATAIIGRPNVGKSSLLNYLLHEDKAIVTDVAGTTRDTLEEYVNVRGVPLKLVDTAGIHHTTDKVEKIGVERSKKALGQADLVLLVLDASAPLQSDDRELLKATQDKKRIILLNKTDLPAALHPENLEALVTDDSRIIPVSILKTAGLDALEAAIAKLFFGEGIENSQSNVLVTNARQYGLLAQAKAALDEVITALQNEVPLDLVQIDMTTAWEKMGEVVGENAPDELITQLFSQFCLGK
ncbi:tRNA uridine-5-carboxymethylaminomethyl(34) synthesis GTPase MnmE [Schleiferilactobacillus harbinensis]|jgi:tRNA modification GTPase|uniref:tRNA modification GTPase MnmE n=2 Tax=Schleiferilactobacillus harbinensis TaxID=304207 RepID=A0A5P8M9W6_9LACO|nr:tRNA uridine-5-carboxymethylaminomethyl(34) synthesis GTPase MnmE [Schleiferilactobacillus harbinensis]MCI1686681.1 tRNA uridine-5-carboxymethylaminomethyl(34) synthesis GTPase MnmE [Schleiferilactobacillus harbinensis]MCI1783780.1 tRNA uridine-5-carboxymethylaminomethyl(34) synthesis GTPase MnmE [Schleiferilactobacillus harbinensis]MCI1849357.1 tRNA uridine-5-carboxymethylaminomethyl(34) synthesis GTPase MnmE [Schleiferilactobacillus harbinensis]MCT2908040.1 tRNA uridine-5-carboxymethylamin